MLESREISIPLNTNELGRVEIYVDVSARDGKSFGRINFKVDSGSDFTIINTKDLLRLGYTFDFLRSCSFHSNPAKAVSSDFRLKLQYIPNITIKFGQREIQGCRIFFSLDKSLSNLLGCDILKYFNWNISYDNCTLSLTERGTKPPLAMGETPVHIYSLNKGE